MFPWRLLLIVMLALAGAAEAAEWQFAVNVEGTKSKAFMWIPPTCKQVRGIVVGQQVILEKCFFEDQQIRAMAEKENLALVFVVPAAIGYDDFGPQGKGAAVFQGILDSLAAVSGYSEISKAPFLTIGHSGGAIFAWRAGYWKPERCFGIIGLHAAPIGPPAHDDKATVDGVPVLDITGQYESWGDPKRPADHHTRWVRGDLLAYRAKWHHALMSELVQPGATHFNWDEALARYVAMFVAKAARARLPVEMPKDGASPVLLDVPLDSGWLTDCSLLDPPRYPAAGYGKYSGDPSMAFWHLDEEIARANEAYQAAQRGRELQLVTFVENGKPVAPAWIEGLKFEPVDDGLTVKVHADFASETPPEFSFPSKRALGHAAGQIVFRLIGGWSGGGEQIGPETFRIKLDRFCFSRNPGSLMIMASHPGDARYAFSEQPCGINFPAKNTNGKPQRITFARLPDVVVGCGPFDLHGTSDSGLPVEYAAVAGPVEIKGRTLTLTQIPPRTAFPVKVTVVAYQWGRSVDPLVQTAVPVEQTFMIIEKPK